MCAVSEEMLGVFRALTFPFFVVRFVGNVLVVVLKFYDQAQRGSV